MITIEQNGSRQTSKINKHPARGHLLSTNCSFDSNKNKHDVCSGTCPLKKASSVRFENLLKIDYCR